MLRLGGLAGAGAVSLGGKALRGEDAHVGPRARVLQWLGLVVFLGASFWPAQGPLRHPLGIGQDLPPRAPRTPVPGEPPSRIDIPASELGAALRADLASGRLGEQLWQARRWYPQGLAPLWILALLAVLGSADRARRRRVIVGGALLVLALALALLEACYLGVEYLSLLPATFGRVEVLLVWFVVVAILFLRRRGSGGVGAVEAHIGAQALLGFVHMLTLPATQARFWLDKFPLGEVLAAVGTNFRPAFWISCGALLLAAAPAYLWPRARVTLGNAAPEVAPQETVESSSVL